MSSSHAAAEVPEPRAVPPEAGTLAPHESSSTHVADEVVLYLNQAVVEAPLGLAVPLIVAEVPATDVAAEVVMVGAIVVENERTEPKDGPAEFEPMAQK